MRMPYLGNVKKKTQEQIIRFAGINYGEDGGDGEFEETLNLSTREYPTLSPRMPRQELTGYNSPSALYVREKLLVVDGGTLKYDGRVVGYLDESITKRQFATINTKVVIFPDKVYYDTVTGETVPLEASFHGDGNNLSFGTNSITVVESAYIDTVKTADRISDYIDASTKIPVFSSVTVNPETGELTLGEQTLKTPAEIMPQEIIKLNNEDREFSVVKSCTESADGTWVIVSDVHEFILTAFPEFSDIFKAGDAVEISGCVAELEGNNGTHIIREISGRVMTFNENIFTAGTPASDIQISRKVPDLECICQSDNRLWGAVGHTIYASALGDPTNFFVYDNLSTDSYSVAVGSDGDFTGCIDYGSAVLFLKEDCIHKVMGNYPAQYEVYTYTVPGIQKGSEKSAVIINERLYYKGRLGIYAYGGSTPVLLSAQLGNRRFTDAVAGTDGTNYYISMKNEDGGWELYVYDTQRRIWLKEDNTRVADFALSDGAVYFIDGSNGKVMRFGKGDEQEDPIPWSATFCEFDANVNGKKRYGRLFFRVELEAGAWFKVEVSRDNDRFRQVFASHNERARIFRIPILPVGCERFRVRISGRGECRVKNMVREFAVKKAGNNI